MSTWNNLSLQDSNSPYADTLILFYNFTMIMLMLITSMTMFMMTNIILNKYKSRFLIKNHLIEIVWTIFPMLILTTIAFPSLKTLYFIDEIWKFSYFTIKSIGHQWYWKYEYPEFKLEFDSFMINENNSKNNFRLLDVDNRMIIPMNTPIRLLTSSMDVIHSWTIPSLGMKLDSTPGRINQMMLFTYRPGLFFGQCSEICGANHSFMPIVLESTSMMNFKNWIKFMNQLN